MLIVTVLISYIVVVYAKRDLFFEKCKRECNSEYGSVRCWSRTTDAFAYGLSTSMIDYCRLIENLARISSNDTNQLNWYNISRTILHEQINQFNLNNKVRQLHKNDIEDIANVLLNKCFSRISTTRHSQPPCPSCSNKELQMIKQWELSSFLLIGFSLILFCLILFLYTFHHHIFSRSYQYIG